MWEKVFELLPGRACSVHRVRLEKMMQECDCSADKIPQMEDVSNFLKSAFFQILIKYWISINDYYIYIIAVNLRFML